MNDRQNSRHSPATRPLHLILADLARHTLAFAKATEGVVAGQAMLLNASRRLLDTGSCLTSEYRSRST